jgi:Mn2+/Fe2+ NRAMP family transporter
VIDSVVATPDGATKAPPRFSVLKLAGPGLIVAATGIGSGDIVSATVGGARYGVVLLWAIALGAFFKFVLSEGIARWQLATGLTALEGWAAHLPGWVKYYFGAYLVLWTVAVSAALTNATGLGIANLSGGAIAQSWGAVAHSLVGCAFVWVGGYAWFERLMKLLVGIMGFSILLCALLIVSDWSNVAQGLLVPTIPSASGTYVLSIIGGIGGSITILSYNYWMREEHISGAGWLGYVRGDVAIAYLFTAIFGISVMLIANQAFYLAGVTITDAQAVPKMAQVMGTLLGSFGVYAYSLGFWAAVFASLLGVWQSVPYLYADFYGIVRNLPPDQRRAVTQVTSTPYRAALAFVTLAPIPFAFTGRPLVIIVIYTIVGSLFIPFLAATLLYLNNRVRWSAAVPHNHWTTNVALWAVLALFAILGAQETTNMF